MQTMGILKAIKPYYEVSEGMLYNGDALNVLSMLPGNSVNCCVTSPPYWGLRDYGESGQIGLEPTPEKYVENMVMVFREVRRVLRDDGTLWLNLGDSYNGYMANQKATSISENNQHARPVFESGRGKRTVNLTPKDMVGIPWRVAFALQADGWILRQDIIWHKSNPMPESVKDRCTKAHEHIFLMSKSQRYYYDQNSILEPVAPGTMPRIKRGRSDSHKWSDGGPGNQTIAKNLAAGFTKKSGNIIRKKNHNPNANFGVSIPWEGASRNKRSVWTVSNKPFSGAHFAVFPPDLIEPCILSGCSKGGIVLDPFVGSGTTAIVAYKHDRKFIGIELSQKYLDGIAIPRIKHEIEQLKLF